MLHHLLPSIDKRTNFTFPFLWPKVIVLGWKCEDWRVYISQKLFILCVKKKKKKPFPVLLPLIEIVVEMKSSSSISIVVIKPILNFTWSRASCYELIHLLYFELSMTRIELKANLTWRFEQGREGKARFWYESFKSSWESIEIIKFYHLFWHVDNSKTHPVTGLEKTILANSFGGYTKFSHLDGY